MFRRGCVNPRLGRRSATPPWRTAVACDEAPRRELSGMSPVRRSLVFKAIWALIWGGGGRGVGGLCHPGGGSDGAPFCSGWSHASLVSSPAFIFSRK